MIRAVLTALLLFPMTGFAQDSAREQAERWDLIRGAVFSERPMQDAGGAVQVSVASKGFEAAFVPVTIRLDTSRHFVSLSLFIDNNPAPLAGVFHFGPAMTPSEIKTRVRVDAYTFIHAVAETEDGALLTAAQYVKAAGGCSFASPGPSAEVMARIGQMQLRRTRPFEGEAIPAQLLISHPNYNGMQVRAASSIVIPARYLETVSVKTGGVAVFDFESNISLSEDPSIAFTYTPAGTGEVEVVAKDSLGSVFQQRFEPLPK